MKQFLRSLLHAALDAVLRSRSRAWFPAADSRCLIIAPHPDDEVLGCANLIQRHGVAGRPVELVYLTNGAASHPDHPRLEPAEIGRMRQAEARQAVQLLGVDQTCLHFLGAPDGSLDRLPPDALAQTTRQIAAVLERFQPTLICLPSRDDASTEHVAAYDLVQAALTGMNLRARVWEYPIWSRWSPRHLLPLCGAPGKIWRPAPGAPATLKRQAIACYRSQTEPTPPWTQAVLPPGFADYFATAGEYFFEGR